jgi:hypothetical protein
MTVGEYRTYRQKLTTTTGRSDALFHLADRPDGPAAPSRSFALGGKASVPHT